MKVTNKLNLTLLWTVIVGSMTGSLWVFNNIAWASDVERIEVRLIKRDIRDLRRELDRESDPADRARLEEYIEQAIDDLCSVSPEDRECK